MPLLRGYVKDRWRVVSQTPSSAQLEKGKHTNHLLHFLLGIPTLGLWWITVWPAVALLAEHKQRYVSVDEFGKVSES